MSEDLSFYNAPGTPLRVAQLRMLEILKEIHAVCTAHQIPYWLDYGTLLGAVRHGGFIPWDDDLDISIMTRDYKKFKHCMNKHLNKNFAYQDWKNEKKLTLKVIKIRDRNSYYNDGIYKKDELTYDGIFVDVFPLDFVPSKKMKMTIDFFYGRAFRRIRGQNISFFEKTVSYLIFPLATTLVVFSKYLSKLRKSTLLMNVYGGLNFKCAHEYNDIFPLSVIHFEGIEFSAPKDFDKHLKNIYGDYMTIPPIEKRQIHAIDIVIYDKKVS